MRQVIELIVLKRLQKLKMNIFMLYAIETGLPSSYFNFKDISRFTSKYPLTDPTNT